MKKLSALFLVLTSLFISSCGSDDDVDCSTISCISPGIMLEFIDKDSGENLLENETINAERIQIEVSGLQTSEVDFTETGSEIFLFIGNWTNGDHMVTVNLDSSPVLEMNVEIETSRSDCCSSRIISDLEITAGDYEEVDDSFFRILID
ncbi:hypothetical protein E0K83_06030 [Gramella sp. BOM4]|nr:hypothetical protein [Christiangramia bathymodioli]